MSAAIFFLALLFLATALYLVAAGTLAYSRRVDCARPSRDFAPPVSIVKPLSGLDEQLEQNLESFYRLDYPSYEIVFSFACRDDPAFEVARAVADRHIGIPSVFVVDPAEPAANSKVNRLAAGVRRARHRYLLFSDGNVRVRPDFLRRAISPFRDPAVGLVSNLFRGSWPESLASRLECLYLNGTLQPGTAAIARLLSRPCVVGKSILMSREALDDIGGFAPVRDYLAEDFLLGVTVERAGYRVVLSADVIDTTEIAKPPAAAWARHRRWAMIRRRVGGAGYAAELLSTPLPWWAGAVALSGGRPGVIIGASALLALRYGAEILIERDGGRALATRDLPLLPLRDALVAMLFWAGLLGRTTAWRGRRVVLGPRTLIEPEAREGGRLLRPTPLLR
jgi:ceramide glucosyltransferase